MKNTILSIILFTIVQTAHCQEYNGVSYKSFEKANSIFSQLENHNYSTVEKLNYVLSGNWYLQGHYSLPKERKHIPIWNTLSFSNDDNYRLMTTIEDGELTLTKTEHFSPDTAYVKSFGQQKAKYGLYLRKSSYIPFYSPISVYHDMDTNRKLLRYIGENDNTITLAYNSSFEKLISVSINKNNYDIESIEFLEYSEIEGDYLVKYNYQNYEPQYGFRLPNSLFVTEWGELVLEMDYSDTKIVLKKKEDVLAGYSLKKLADNLYLIVLPTGQHQSFVVDFGGYLGIIEIPISEIYAKQITDFVKLNFPQKDIKYAFLTHHHPDHAGGFAYLYKNGVDVVTTPISKSYQAELLKRQHLLRAERLTYTKDGEFIVLPSLEKRDFGNENIEMIAYEMGENSHTKEFILYYFPQSKILVVGDLFYTSEVEVYASVRAKDINNFIEKEQIDVEKLYQTWGWKAKEYSTIEELQESVRLYDKKKLN